MSFQTITEFSSKLKQQVIALGFEESESKQLFFVSDGLGIRLHNNNGLRPTVYQISLKINKSGFVDRMVLDTIINETKGIHQMIKLHYNKKEEKVLATKIFNLLSQEALGSREETSLLYEPIGLLYRKK